MKAERNIVLIGMSGCGKSTVGRLVADALGMSFVDADLFLEQKEGRSISEIFACFGEQYFRRLEAETLAELAKRKNTVIATGGGAVKSPDAMKSFKNALIIFIKRDVEEIIATADSSVRPLFTDPDAVREMYHQRRPLYEKYCNFSVENEDINKCTRDILRIVSK